MNHLASLALLGMLVSPVLGNPCQTCGLPRYVAPRRVVKKNVVIERRVEATVTTVAVPYFVNSYVATVLPAPSVTYNITTPSPPPQPVQQVQANVSTQAVFASPVVTTTPGVPLVAAPLQQQQGGDALAAVLAKFDARLCLIEGALVRIGMGGDPGQPPPPQGTLPGQPLARPNGGFVYATKCAVCHDKGAAAADGKGHAFSDGMSFVADAAVKALMLKKARAGHMPPPGNKKGVPALTQAELAGLEEFLK